MNNALPTLYKLTSKGAVQVWNVSVDGNVITRTYGLLEGKQQSTNEVIKVGKNLGKVNATTPEQQAVAEAQAEWEHKLAKDYFIDLESAKGQVDRLAKEGGYLPMLAQEYRKHGARHLRFPCMVQPKLDGLRCVSTKIDGKVAMWFRSGKLITTLPNINLQLNRIMLNGDILDGELYIHGEDFNSFTGAIRASVGLNEQTTDRIQYWIYDCPRIGQWNETHQFAGRFGALVDRIGVCTESIPNLKLVETQMVSSFDESMRWYEQWISDGFEGMMFRNYLMPYEQKRSYNLLKYKDFDEDEFPIVDYVEGRGHLAGHVGAFVCATPAGNLFNAKMKGNTEYLKELFEHPEQFEGKSLTVKYFRMSKDLIPRFPVAKAIRFDK